MPPLSQPSLLLQSGGLALLTLVLLLLDLSVPADYAVWLLYAVPLALAAARFPRPIFLSIAGLVALLAVIGAIAGSLPLSSWVNRLLGIGLMAGLAVLPATRRNASDTREQAWGEPAGQTMEAIAHAEAAVEGAVAGRRKAEAELHRDKLRFEGIVQSAMDAIITVDEGQKIVLFNQAAEDMFHWSAQDMLGRRLDRLIPERFRSAHAEHIQEFGRSGVTTRHMGALGEIRGIRSTGEEFPLEAAISQIDVEGVHYYTVILRDMTARKRLEEELAEREGLLRAIIETEPECVKVLALDGTVRTMNAAGLAMIEAACQADVVGKDICHLVVGESRSVLRDLIRKAAEGEAGRLEFQLVGLLGTPRWVDTHVVPLRAADGSITAVLGVTRDITEWKKTEQLLRQSEERYRRLLSVLPDAILVVRDNRIVFANEQGLRLFGVGSAEELQERGFSDLIPAAHREAVAERIRHLLEGGGTAPEAEEQITRVDGVVVDVAVRAAHFRDQDGTGILLVLRDMTMRKARERRLRESEERLQSLLGAMEDVIWSSTLDLSSIHYVSPSVAEIYGRSAEEFLARPSTWLEVVHAEDRALVEQSMQQLQATGELDVEYRIVRRDGDIRWVHDRGRIIKDRAGHPVRIDGIATDITERKRLQAQLRRTERVAELGTVASGMAHEIGTPMNVILGRAEYLMERTKEESVKKGLQTIISQVERITRVMNQLLAFARRRPIEHRAIDLRQTIEDNLEIFHERLSYSRITVETSFAEGCPCVHADADQMSQVLINLIMNAIHAMPDGGLLRATLAPMPDRGMVKLAIADTGHGMPQDIIAKIFDPFFTTKEFGKGTGLGLTVVKGIIEEHSGTIQVESRPGVGTVFTICLPIAKS